MWRELYRLSWRCRLAYKPGSVSAERRTVTIYLAPHPVEPDPPCFQGDVAAGVKQPTRERAGHPWFPYLALLQVGFGRRCVATRGRTLLPPDFTLAATQRGQRRYVSVPLSVPRPPYGPRPGRYPAPCPVEPGLSSPGRKRPAAATRPTRHSPESSLAQLRAGWPGTPLPGAFLDAATASSKKTPETTIRRRDGW